MVPKLIFQSWKTRDIPDEWKEAQKSVIKNNSGYVYTLFTDEDNRHIVMKFFPDFLETYDEFKQNIQRADAVRYMYMYIWGGFYLDLDYVALRSFDDLHISKPIGLINTNSFQKTTTNSFLMSEPRHGVWLKCLHEMKTPSPWWIRWSPGLDVLYTTGPNMLHRVYNEHRNEIEKLPHVVAPCDVCQLYVSNEKTCQIPEEASSFILYQIPGASWNGPDMKAMNVIYCYRYYILLLVCIICMLSIVCNLAMSQNRIFFH